MKFCVGKTLLLVELFSASATSVTQLSSRSLGDHPVVGVVDLLKSLKQKVLEEGEAEEITYAKFSTWCTGSERSLEKAVEKSKEAIEILESEIDSKAKQNETLTKQISKLEEEIAEYEQAGTDADKAREDENKLYVQADTDLGSTIDAFSSVIAELKGAKDTVSSALLQDRVRSAISGLSALAAGKLSDSQMQRLSAMAGREDPEGDKEMPDFLAKGDYGDHVTKYEFKSNNIIDLLKELKMQFEDQRVAGTKQETNSLNAHNLAKNARDAAVEAAKNAKTEKTTTKGEVESDLATARGTLTDTQGDLEADETTLSDTKTDCKMKKTEWEERSTLRQREIEAMDAGIAILAKVSGVRTEAPANPALPAAPADEGAGGGSFLQQSDPKAKAVNLLRQEAKRLHSKKFGKFAEEVAAKLGGPFDDVNDMVQKMIFRLMAEQTDEDDHKNWCDVELSKTEASKTNKEEKIKQIDLKLDADKASVGLLATEVEDADKAAAELEAFIQESTEIRNIGKKENMAAIEDAKKAQDAIAQAVAVLESFYKDSGMVAKESYEFVQAPVELGEKPSTWEAGYTGVADPKNQPEGIITMLEKISSDFSQMEADTKAQEVTDQKNFAEQMKSAEIEKARRVKESEMKAQEKQRLLEKITSLEKSKKHTKDELGAVDQYLKDLSPACLEGDSTYEDRKAARAAEITALKEAQVILAEAFDESASTTPLARLLVSHSKSTKTVSSDAKRNLRAVKKHK